MNLEYRVQRLEEKEERHINRVSELKESLALLTNELRHVAGELEENNKNTGKIADNLNKLQMIFYIFVAAASVTAVPTLGEALPLIFEMVR